ncbi:MAG: serine/threonine-protein kinase [Planctomycetota bacterium]
MSASEGRVETWIDQRMVEYLAELDHRPTLRPDEFLLRSKVLAETEFVGEQRIAAVAGLERRLDGLGRAERLLTLPHVIDPLGDGASLPDFEVLGKIGQGGYGQVFRARQQSVDREVAIKVPLLASALSARDRERLRREAAAIAGLNHPGIVTLHQLTELHGTPLLVMELVDGTPLDQVVADLRDATGPSLAARIGRPELGHVAAACAVAREVLEALAYAHERGVIHRDLKPSNVMIDRDGRARLLDFGLARTEGAASLTRSTDLLGTPQFLAPELLDDPTLVGRWTDVYAAGVLLYQLLTLRYPFGGGPLEATLARIRAGDAIPARAGRNEIPVDLAAIVDKAMNRLPEARYGSCGEFHADLGRLDAGEPIVARPVGRLGRLVRKVRRRPEVAGAVGLVVVAAIVFGGLSWKEAHARHLEHHAQIGAAHERAQKLIADEQWSRAADVLEGVAALSLAGRTEPAMRAQQERMQEQLAVVLRLEELRDLGHPRPSPEVEAGYAEVFGRLGFDLDAPVPAVAAAVRSHALADRLLVGLDEWIRGLAARGAVDRARELQVLADTADPNAARVRIRGAYLAGDAKVLREIAASAELLDLPPPVLDALAQALEDSGAEADAGRVYRLGPILHPGDYWMHRRLAAFLTKTPRDNDDRVAAQSLRSALLLRPDEVPLLSELALIFSRIGEAELGLRCARRAVELDPQSSRAHASLARALTAAGAMDEALAAWGTAADVAGHAAERAHAVYRFGMLLENEGRSVEARAKIEEAIALDPDNARPYLTLAFIRFARFGDLDRAEALLRRCLELDPSRSDSRVLLATIHEQRGDAAAALPLYREILELHPSESLARQHTYAHSAAICALVVAEEPIGPGGPADENERLALREQAVAWLEDSLGACLRLIMQEPKEERSIRRWLRSWRREHGVRQIRDEEWLAQLPAPLAARVRELWARVEAVMRLPR